MSDRALCPCCAATWTWLDGPACPHCGWNARDATAGMGAARAVVEESLRKAGWTNTVHSSGAGGTGGGGGGGSSTANIPVYVEGHAYPVAYARARYVSPAWSPPEVPRDPSWQDSRKTWLETGDLSALTAMDACDPSGMSGDDWLDCDEYDAKRTPAPELPPAPGGHRVNTVMALALLLAWLLAVLIVHGVI